MTILWDLLPKIGSGEPRGLNGWISIKDRLPNRNEEVLVLIQSKVTNFIKIAYRFSQDDERVERKWSVLNEKHITHWQPLPSAEVEP